MFKSLKYAIKPTVQKPPSKREYSVSIVQPDKKRPILTPDSKEVQTRIFVDQIHELGAEMKELESANQALTTENENLKKQLDLLNLKVAKMNISTEDNRSKSDGIDSPPFTPMKGPSFDSKPITEPDNAKDEDLYDEQVDAEQKCFTESDIVTIQNSSLMEQDGVYFLMDNIHRSLIMKILALTILLTLFILLLCILHYYIYIAKNNLDLYSHGAVTNMGLA